MAAVRVLGVLCIAAPLAASWTQQYADSASTNFVNYQGPPYVGWNYSGVAQDTLMLTGTVSPSVSDEGVLFYYSNTSLIAVNPRGMLLWDVEVAPVLPYGFNLINSVYSKKHNFAIGGAFWQIVANRTFVNYFQMVAVHAGNGSVAWKVMDNDLYDSTLISLSTSADAVYVGGFDHGTFAALSLKDGSIVWKKTGIYKVGLLMQTKVGPTEVSASEYELQEAVLLPTDPVISLIYPQPGRLFSYEVSAGLANWQSDLGFSFVAKFGISNQGMVFGSDWGGILGSGKSIFGVHSHDGSLVFNNNGYCDPSARGDGYYANGPAVDAEGYAYYSCGNQVFSIFPNGSLRWITPASANVTSNRIISPSIHPDGYVYYFHSVVDHENDETVQVLALSTKDGSLHKKYDVLQRDYIEPPILLGSQVMYLVANAPNPTVQNFVIYSVQL